MGRPRSGRMISGHRHGHGRERLGEQWAFCYAVGRCSPASRKRMHLGEGRVRRPTGTAPPPADADAVAE
jgi:hypothetical protein